MVSKDELLDKLWPGQVVSETVLTRCITSVRKAVGDDGTKQEIIQTHHGRGYRFIAPLITTSSEASSQEVVSRQQSVGSSQEEENGKNTGQAEGLRPEAVGPSLSSPSSLQPVASSLSADFAPLTPSTQSPARNTQHSPAARFSRGFLLAAVLLSLVTAVTVHYLSLPVPSTQPLTPNPQSLPLPDKPSIIVLPFTNLSDDPDQDYFSDGLTDELITDLSRIPQLFVIARQSAFTYKGKQTKVQDISREIGVRYVLEGSVQRAEKQLRILAQLSDAATGEQLWAERYDLELSDTMTVQEQIRQKIAALRNPELKSVN